MTNEEIDAIEARANAATSVFESRLIERENGPDGFALLDEHGRSIGLAYELADAEFACHAQRDALSLVAGVRRLRAKLQEIGRVVRVAIQNDSDASASLAIDIIGKVLGGEDSPT